jgi:hypothetical protein
VNRRRFTTAAGAALAGLLVACQPLPPPPVPIEAPDPGPLVVGDSITWQLAMSGGMASHPEWRAHMQMGWDMTHADDRILAEADAGTLVDMVVLLGTNDSSPARDGWTRTDENLWASRLLNLHPDTRVALVTPWLSPDAGNQHRFYAAVAAEWMHALAELRPNTVVVDWADYQAPNVLSPDGIHLAHGPGGALDLTPEAAAARLAVIEDAVEALS